LRNFLERANPALQRALFEATRWQDNHSGEMFSHYPGVCHFASLGSQQLLEEAFPGQIRRSRLVGAHASIPKAFPFQWHIWLEISTVTQKQVYASLTDGQFDEGYPKPAYRVVVSWRWGHRGKYYVATPEYLDWYKSDPRHSRVVVMDVTDERVYREYLQQLGLDPDSVSYDAIMTSDMTRQVTEQVLALYRTYAQRPVDLSQFVSSPVEGPRAITITANTSQRPNVSTPQGLFPGPRIEDRGPAKERSLPWLCHILVSSSPRPTANKATRSFCPYPIMNGPSSGKTIKKLVRVELLI